MTDYHIQLKKEAQQQGPVKRWWLDFPSNNAQFKLNDLAKSGFVFQGWVLSDYLEHISIYVKYAGIVSTFPLNVERPDVIKIILKQDPNQHKQLRCGFRFAIQLETADFELGVLYQDTYTPLCFGHVAGPFKVLQGKHNWLFLDNDTNKSVEQFTGKYLLDITAKSAWQSYMHALLEMSQRLSCKHVLLLAPAKEAVYEQFYPYKKAKVTPVEQVISLAPIGLNLCYPLTVLRDHNERTFRLTDTHWTPYGAMLASVELAVLFGLDKSAIEALFADDQYKEVNSVGDLGNKVYPQIMAVERLLTRFSYRQFLVSDNQLANFGRTMVLNNTNALQKGHLVIFGASSSYSMLDYLSRIFSKITLMHTAGNIDQVEAAKLAPDYLVCQSNARYVVRAPVADYDLAAIIAKKEM